MLKQGRQHWTGPGGPCLSLLHVLPPLLFCIGKRKGKQRKIERFIAETIKKLSPRQKCYCFSHSRASRIQTFFLSVNQGGWQVFFSVPWPLLLEINFAGPVKYQIYLAVQHTNHFEKIKI